MTIERGKLFSEKVPAGSRTYFFDVKKSAGRIKYLVISESRQISEKSHEHNQVMVFQEHLVAFKDGFSKAFKFMIEESKFKAYLRHIMLNRYAVNIQRRM